MDLEKKISYNTIKKNKTLSEFAVKEDKEKETLDTT